MQGFGGVRTLSISSSVGEWLPPSSSIACDAAFCWESVADIDDSLEKDASRRATPWRMLEHPWMVDMQAKKVNMEHFLKQVWDWKD